MKTFNFFPDQIMSFQLALVYVSCPGGKDWNLILKDH
jgi:hypothetical protein